MLSTSPGSIWIGEDPSASSSSVSSHDTLRAQLEERSCRLGSSSSSSLSSSASPSSPLSPVAQGSSGPKIGAQLLPASRRPRKLARHSRPSSATSEASQTSLVSPDQDAMTSSASKENATPSTSGLQLFNLPLFVSHEPGVSRQDHHLAPGLEEASKRSPPAKAQRASSLRDSPHSSHSPKLGGAAQVSAARSRSLRVALPTSLSAEHASTFASQYHSPGRSDRTLPYSISRESSEESEVSSGAYKAREHNSDWLQSSRRWSSSISHSRSAKMFKQAASPYLRAGLEELKSIFDVDSDPVPSSPFEDDDEEDTAHESDAEDGRSGGTFSEIESGEGGRREGSSASSASRASNLRRLLRGTSATERQGSSARRNGSRSPRFSPRGLSSHVDSSSILPTSIHSTGGQSELKISATSSSPRQPTAPLQPKLLQSSRREPAIPASSLGLTAGEEESMSHSAASPYTTSSEKANLNSLPGRAAASDDVLLAIPHSEKSARPSLLDDPDVRGRQVAIGLALIAIGMVSACAFGERFYNDTFSASLLIFFLVQPAFALLGLAALLARRRAVMDLFSRAMRAHVLLQGIIALLAFLDLSASASYVRKGAFGGAHFWVMELIPSMQSRFGPWSSIWDASTAPAAALLSEAAHASQGEAQIHAHDTSVGSLSSRFTHFIIFLAQAAVPLVLALWAQFHLARALGLLARSPTLRRSGSVRGPSRRTSIKQRPSSHGGRSRRQASHVAEDATPPVPAFDATELASRLHRIDAAAASKSGRASSLEYGRGAGVPQSRVGQQTLMASATLPAMPNARSQRVSLLASPAFGQGFTYGLGPTTPDLSPCASATTAKDAQPTSPRSRTWSHRNLSPLSASPHAVPVGAPGVAVSPHLKTAKVTYHDGAMAPRAEEVGLSTSPPNMQAISRTAPHRRRPDEERHHRSLSQQVVISDGTKALLGMALGESQHSMANPSSNSGFGVSPSDVALNAHHSPSRHSETPHT
ncbi:hypothetical protein CBOM_05327 [Ceraceosorus bombacis]|uniref:Uncharacterized protein n=1 Tax=Ceraceosorus bombacis TaxID=401625 RepID=A0A0P1BQJ9_9BASI|nr:hypothetical protein CBOM_05327 [Ceraceosorus bombacis]